MDSLRMLILLLGLAAAVAAANSPPDCTGEVTNLQPCLVFVKGEVASPPQDCCDGLQQIHARKPECLCLLASSTMGIGAAVPGINGTAAQEVPRICKVEVDPSRCPALLAGAPEEAPSPGASAAQSSGSAGASYNSNSAPMLLQSCIPLLILVGSFQLLKHTLSFKLQ